MTTAAKIQEIRDFLGVDTYEPLERRYIVEALDSTLVVLKEIVARVDALEFHMADLDEEIRELKTEEW